VCHPQNNVSMTYALERLEARLVVAKLALMHNTIAER
jgi:hypothetical protein